jgi:hypothetical protein
MPRDLTVRIIGDPSSLNKALGSVVAQNTQSTVANVSKPDSAPTASAPDRLLV